MNPTVASCYICQFSLCFDRPTFLRSTDRSRASLGQSWRSGADRFWITSIHWLAKGRTFIERTNTTSVEVGVLTVVNLWKSHGYNGCLDFLHKMKQNLKRSGLVLLSAFARSSVFQQYQEALRSLWLYNQHCVIYLLGTLPRIGL